MQNQLVLNAAPFVFRENHVSAEIPNDRYRVLHANKLFNFNSNDIQVCNY